MNHKPISFSSDLLWVVGLIMAAAATRLLPHPFNFTAIGALSLFSGARVNDKRMIYVLPFVALIISDLILGFRPAVLPVYVGFGLYVLIGSLIRKKETMLRIGLSAVSGSLAFFLLTNLPCWYLDLQLYPMNLEGLRMSYLAGLPFLANQLAADLIYSAVLFGVHSIVTRRTVSFS